MKVDVYGSAFVDHTVRHEPEQIAAGRSAIDALVANLASCVEFEQHHEGKTFTVSNVRLNADQAKALILNFVDSYNAGRATGAGI